MTAVRKPSRLSRLAGFIAFRLVPLLLVVVIVWTAFQAAGVAVNAQNANQQTQLRQTDYAATASALAPANQQGSVMRLIAQFATNTPVATPVPTIAVATSIPLPTLDPDVPPTPYVVPTFFPAPPSDIQTIAGTAVPTPVPLIPRQDELINIMLLGGDDELVTDGTVRTDTMIIASINTVTRTVSILSLPRDLFVYVPTPTMSRLNTVYGIGESFGWQGGGWELLRETIFYNFGINVHYFAKINFTGFEQIIDTVGGVEIAVDCSYQDYYPKAVIDPNLPPEQNYELRTLPVGYYKFNGFDALWYARTRRVSDDFDRGRRQQQMLRAILRAALAQGLVNSVPQLWGQITDVVTTDIPLDVVLGLLPIAVSLNPDDIQSYTMIRTYHTTPWQPTEGAFAGQYVQLPVYEPIRQLLTEFYQPPTGNQISAEAARILVYNGSGNADWDRVAVDKLREAGIPAIAGGSVEAEAQTHIVDRVGDDKGSPLPGMLDALNLNTGGVMVQPDAARTEDYTVILGADYQSCSSNVLSPSQLGD